MGKGIQMNILGIDTSNYVEEAVKKMLAERN